MHTTVLRLRQCKAPHNETHNYRVKLLPYLITENPLSLNSSACHSQFFSLPVAFFPSSNACILHVSLSLPLSLASSAGAAADRMTSPARWWTAVFKNGVCTYAWEGNVPAVKNTQRDLKNHVQNDDLGSFECFIFPMTVNGIRLNVCVKRRKKECEAWMGMLRF